MRPTATTTFGLVARIPRPTASSAFEFRSQLPRQRVAEQPTQSPRDNHVTRETTSQKTTSFRFLFASAGRSPISTMHGITPDYQKLTPHLEERPALEFSGVRHLVRSGFVARETHSPPRVAPCSRVLRSRSSLLWLGVLRSITMYGIVAFCLPQAHSPPRGAPCSRVLRSETLRDRCLRGDPLPSSRSLALSSSQEWINHAPSYLSWRDACRNRCLGRRPWDMGKKTEPQPGNQRDRHFSRAQP